MVQESTRDGNRIKIAEMTRGSDLRRLSATIHQTIEVRGYTEVILDFSNCVAATEAAMLPLMPLIVGWRESKASYAMAAACAFGGLAVCKAFATTFLMWQGEQRLSATLTKIRGGGHTYHLRLRSQGIRWGILIVGPVT